MPEIVRILKDGYWDRTAVVRGEDGGLRVRKESKESDDPGPWAHAALRKEIVYLQSLPEGTRESFPNLLESWDGKTIGYEMPFYEDRQDFSTLVLGREIDQETADEMQGQLSELLFHNVHVPVADDGLFASHVCDVLKSSINALGEIDKFAPLVEAEAVELNGRELPGLRRSLDELLDSDVLERLAAIPTVRLHGDLILENILWSPLLLIDPVSVAGLDCGPPLFDLVKYESFASGELFAIREEVVTAEPEEGGYRFEIPWGDPALASFARLDLQSTFRAGYERRYGEVDLQLCALLDAYFSLVMARNTSGTHQWARVLKAAEILGARTSPSAP